MKNILVNKKWICIIALLLLVVSLSSCSGQVEELGSGNLFTDGPIYSISMFYLIWMMIFSIIVIICGVTGITPNMNEVWIDGKRHTITTYEKREPSSLDTILSMLYWAYRKPLSLVLGVILQTLIFYMTGKINIWLDIIIIALSQYATYWFVKNCPTIIRILFYILLIAAIVTLAYYIVIFINAMGEM